MSEDPFELQSLWKKEENESRASERADDACSARKCPETGKKDREGEREGGMWTEHNLLGGHKGVLFRA